MNIIIKFTITFDRSELFKPWGILLGDENPVKSPMSFPKLRVSNKEIDEKLKEQNDIKSVDKEENK